MDEPTHVSRNVHRPGTKKKKRIKTRLNLNFKPNFFKFPA